MYYNLFKIYKSCNIDFVYKSIIIVILDYLILCIIICFKFIKVA